MYRYDEIHAELADDLLNRFLRYVKVHTTSDERIAPEKTPSTECQWTLIRMLEDELRSIGIETVEVDENGFLIARIPGNLPAGKAVDTIGFMAHVDTSSDAPGENVMPIVHERYDGGVIELGNGIRLDPAEYPGLERYRGETIVTAGGGTLLGADDNLAGSAVDRRCDGRHHNGVEQSNHLLSADHHHGTTFIRPFERVHPYIATIYSSGHTPSSSHPASSAGGEVFSP